MFINLVEIEQFVKQAHGAQRRSNGAPYYTHPISVKERLLAAGVRDKAVLATALLHDVLEDTGVELAAINALAGDVVGQAVLQLTIPKHSDGSTFDKHLHLFNACKGYNDIAKRVKLADRIDNLTDAINDWKPERTKQYALAGLAIISIMTPFPNDVQLMAMDGLLLIKDILAPGKKSLTNARD